ncbi:hypothetical protein SARC_08555 [Sphaeroforma arctica JP610]|uniref:ribonuclease P n=1 Tax=Sphaeroforma arctica JP610 TaxID=667725 RepID=A0A0L0FR69_9EUKA|nr:hypothetical protein SARC_08555 [Sphaeroforma arctica JP610]KNC79041.1 hypothetical protein SARC_08555 [Sphaeroforma arctica JP610]|eukprot:XP_014152943.1 hypothetical protein SARC_08555 [Sphaeroforma arctica JP610]
MRQHVSGRWLGLGIGKIIRCNGVRGPLHLRWSGPICMSADLSNTVARDFASTHSSGHAKRFSGQRNTIQNFTSQISSNVRVHTCVLSRIARDVRRCKYTETSTSVLKDGKPTSPTSLAFKGDASERATEYNKVLVAFEKLKRGLKIKPNFQPEYLPQNAQELVEHRNKFWAGGLSAISLQHELFLFHIVCEANLYTSAKELFAVCIARGADKSMLHSQFMLVESSQNGIKGALRVLNEMQGAGIPRSRRTYTNALIGLKGHKQSLKDGLELVKIMSNDTSNGGLSALGVDEVAILELLDLGDGGELRDRKLVMQVLSLARDNCLAFSNEGMDQFACWLKRGVLGSEWNTGMTTVSPGGVCSSCQNQVTGVMLSSENKAALAREISLMMDDDIVKGLRTNNKMMKYDLVVDAMNVCHDAGATKRKPNSTNWNLKKLQGLVKQVTDDGLFPLMTIRQHVIKDAPAQSRPFLEKLYKNKQLLVVHEDVPDDYVWVLMALWNDMNTLFVSNDKLRDHEHKFAGLSPYLQPLFRLWRQSHQVCHQYVKNQWYVGVPRTYDLVPQFDIPVTHMHIPRVADTTGSYLIPSMNDRWLCATQVDADALPTETSAVHAEAAAMHTDGDSKS